MYVKENQLEISGNGKSVNYTFADPSMIVTPTKESIDIPEPDLDIEIAQQLCGLD